MGQSQIKPRALSRLSTWALRIGYLVSLSTIAAISAHFYVEQRGQTEIINRIGALGEQFAVVDGQMEDVAVKAEGIARTFPAERDRRTVRLGLSLQERRALEEARPVDPQIRSTKTALLYHIGRAASEMEYLKALWLSAPPELAARISQTSRYMVSAEPFQHHDVLVSAERVEKAKTPFDMHWAALEIASLYENNVARSNRHAQIEIRGFLEEQSRLQGDMLQRFLLITMASLLFMLLVIFIPVDVGIQRMIAELNARQREKDEAMRSALAADRAKSEFLANMSHEIRTPMNGVLGMAELLARTELTAKQRTFADVIVKSGHALLTIINDILDFSKIDANQIHLESAPFDLKETVEDVATLVSGRVAEKDLELIVRIQPDLPSVVEGDVGRIRQVLTNLVGNAVKFTEKGHVLIDVSGQTGDDGNATLSFAVTDTGIGIPDEKLPSVFDKFSQVDSSSTRRHEGTGLGLAIARRLVELMSGEIGVESAIGEGSRFWFSITLPIHADAVQAIRPAPVDVTDAGILIIEDNAVNRAILIEQLQSWRFDCAAVEDGPSGIQFLKEARAMGAVVDLVILDYQMPEMNGADVARAIREDAALADTAILLLSSVDQVDEMRFVRELSVEGHLSKPTRSSLLLETITSIIQTTRATRRDGPQERGQRHDRAGIPETAQSKIVPVESGKPHAAPVARQTLDILVAEDNEVNQIVFTQALSDMPFAFELVGNGRLALERWESASPSLILMDVSMPEMNGHEATAAIRAREKELGLQRTPIVAVTAHALNGDREKCLEAGIDDYLTKPISPDMLAAKIGEWLDRPTEKRIA